MKTIFYRILYAVAKLSTFVAAILGCSARSDPEKPREIRWHGQETGYQATTPVPAGGRSGGSSNH